VLERHGSCTPIAVTLRDRFFANLHPVRVQSAFNRWLSFPFSVSRLNGPDRPSPPAPPSGGGGS
jgi:hypothetical protein